MDDLVSLLLTYRAGLLCLCVVILTFFVRRIVETAVPSLKGAKAPYQSRLAAWWGEVLLPLVPILVGVGLALGVSELAPETRTGVKSIYGLILGWSSSVVYKVVSQALKAKTGVELPPSS